MPLIVPAYTYVPGHWPHPNRDPEGHRFDQSLSPAKHLNLTDWETCTRYTEGIELFNQGYYWEAHEAWEEIWRLDGKHGPQGQLLQGLIKIAAAGIKIRQGHSKASRSLLTQASKHINKVMDKHPEKFGAGLHLKVLERWCRDFRDEVGDIEARPTLPVEILFPELKLESVND